MTKGTSSKKAGTSGTRGGAPHGDRPAWSPEERKFLEENRETMSEKEIADRLGRSKSGVRHMRNRLKIGPPKRAPIEGYSWTDELDATIRSNPDMPPKEMARLLGRTEVAVLHRRRHLGLTKSRDETAWRPDEDDVLKANPDKPPKWLAERLDGRTVTAIRARRRALGLPRYVAVCKWTEQDIGILKDNIQAPMDELARLLPGRSEASIRSMARKHGRKRIIRKGYSMTNGYISRYTEGQAVLDHHIVMEREIGRKLKQGEVVHHINCDKTDNRTDNLDILPDGSAHGSAHSSFHRLLPELLSAGIVRYDRGNHAYEVAQDG